METCLNCDIGQSSSVGATSCFFCGNNTIADLPGTPSCIECGNHTVAVAKNTKCGYDCSSLVIVPENSWLRTVYNITRLKYELRCFEIIKALFSESSSIPYGDSVITFSLCGHNPECDNETYVCMIGNDTFTGMVDMGRIAAIDELTGHSGLQFTFTYGDTFGFRANQSACSTVLIARCDPSSTDPPVVYDDSKFSSDCVMVLQWNHMYAVRSSVIL